MKKIYIIQFILLFVISINYGQTYNMPSGSGTANYSTCSGTFYDNNGTGNYNNNQDSYITFCPNTPGDAVRIQFTSFSTEQDYDYLEMWYGSTAVGPPTEVFTGSLSAFSRTSSSPDGCITFHFVSDGLARDAGWTATITCIQGCATLIANIAGSNPMDICSPNSNNGSSLTVNFDGSGSSTSGSNPIVSYVWDWGDGTNSTTTTPTTSHTFPTVGIYTVKLVVRDNNTSINTQGCQSYNDASVLVRFLPDVLFSNLATSPINVTSCSSSINLTATATPQTLVQPLPLNTGAPIDLPDIDCGGGGTYTSTLDLTGFFPSGATMSAGCYPTLNFSLWHSYAGDLQIDLIAPNGTSVRVYNRTSGMMFGTCASDYIADCSVQGCVANYSVVNTGGTAWGANLVGPSGNCPTYTGTCYNGSYHAAGTYTSANSFAALNGVPLNGVWTLRIIDNVGFDSGEISSWSLSFPPSCLNPGNNVTPDVVSLNWNTNSPDPISQNPTTLMVTNPSGNCATCIGQQMTNNAVAGPFTTNGTYTYTVTAIDEFGCEFSRDITVNVNIVNAPATFNAIPAQCAGGTNPLPSTSLEGWSGTWSPAFDANNSGSYVFTPDITVAGQECALPSAPVAVTITPQVQATFAAIAAQCAGGTNPLPSTSQEGFSGTWSPAFDANNSGSYVFTPDTTVAGQECALPSAAVAVTITPQVQATFAAIPAQCAGGTNPLPSTSQEGFSGTWSPSFDANNSGSYVFTPDTTVAGQECALPSAAVAVTIYPLPGVPTVTALVDYCLNETAIQLSATGSSGSTLLWYTVATGGTGTITAPTPTTTVAGVTSYWVSQITSNGCEGPRAEIQVNVHSVIAKPIVTVIAPSCGVNGSAQISNFDPDPTLNYSFTPPGPLYDMVGNITNLVYGTSYEVTASVASCSVTSDPFTVNQMLATPSILVTNNSPSICDGDMTNIVVTGLQAGEILNWIVNANEVNGLISGQGTSFTDSILTLFSGIETPRVVNIRFYADNGSCTSSFHDIDITVNPRPDIMVSPNSPEEQTICSGETTNIEISSSYPNVNFTWEVISNVNGVLGASNGTGDSIAQTLSVSGTLQGVVVYRLHAFIGSCESVNTIDFTVYVNPKPVYNPIITPTAICDGSIINLNYSHPNANVTFGWDLVLTNADVVGGILSGVTTTNSLNLNQAFTLIDSLVAGQATFTVWVDLNGCKSDPFTATIDIHPNPQVQLQDGAICVQDGQVYQTYWLNAGVLPLGGDYEYEWFMVDTAGDISLGTTTTPYYEVVMAGSYYVVVTNVDVLLGTNCSGMSNTVQVIETNPATLANATAVVTDFFTGNGIVTITVTDGNGTLEYQLDEGEFQSSNVFTGVSAGPHTITVVDTQGCTYFTIPVLVVDYPKFFTPNGDGYNDTWNIIGLEQENAKLYIFDRYGKLIKQINTLGANQGNGWDGTLNGEPLPSTDYWFSLEYEENGIMKEFKAHFSLKR